VALFLIIIFVNLHLDVSKTGVFSRLLAMGLRRSTLLGRPESTWISSNCKRRCLNRRSSGIFLL